MLEEKSESVVKTFKPRDERLRLRDVRLTRTHSLNLQCGRRIRLK
jgi:hypothetical protein